MPASNAYSNAYHNKLKAEWQCEVEHCRSFKVIKFMMRNTWSFAAAKWSIHKLWRGATCYGAAGLCTEQILSTYEYTVSVFYAPQIILIVVLLKCEVDPCPDKSRFDSWPSTISVIDPWLSSWPKIRVQNILECHPLVDVLLQYYKFIGA